MKTMRKEELDKAAWSWADTTDPKSVSHHHVELAYRIGLDVCKPNSCRRNCRGNPRCLSGLGESKWFGPKAAAAAEEAWSANMVDPNEERRIPGSFVGLKNLGATCYVNSLLQLWFHNIRFRLGIYSWCPEEDTQESTNETLIGNEYTPVSSIGHLQLLFALLQFGNRNSVDPTNFILSLGLDTSQQQDAQEFSKLFISMLEERLSLQSSPLVKNIINEQFCGKYSYVTKCQLCGTESARPSLFYELELNIAGHKTLADCLEEFLQNEKLEGADRYHCTVCKSKQDATRHIKLDTLPPVLNLQLMRFVFDRQKSCKKKLHSFLQFPENLDMSAYLDKPAGSLLYVLSAVLIHRGQSAYSGHYVAHICDSTTSTWYKFNDECVEKMEGKKLKLGAEEEDVDGNKKVKPQRLPKGFLMSNNAYMLVYTDAKQASEQIVSDKKSIESIDSVNWNLPQRVKELVQKEDQKFEDWVKEINDTKAVTVESGKAKQQEMINLYNLLPVTDDNCFEFINSDWLVKWLTTDEVKPIDNSNIICLHGKLDPCCVPQTKCISSTAASMLYEKYDGGPRLTSKASMCLPCVKHRCQLMRLKAKTAEDSKKVTSLLKSKPDSNQPSFWIGKNSLRCWRKLVLEELEDVQSRDITDEVNGHDSEVQISQNLPKVQNKVGNDNIAEVESSDVSSNVKHNDSTSVRATRSKSKVKIESNGCEENYISQSSQIVQCNDPSSVSLESSCDSSVIRNRKALLEAKAKNNKEEGMEFEITASASSDCGNVVNETVSSDMVSSSDEVLEGKCAFGKDLSENGSEVSLTSSSDELNSSKTKRICNPNPLSLNGISKPKYVRIKTPGFGDDIIQRLDDMTCEHLEKSFSDADNEQSKGVKRDREYLNKQEETVSTAMSAVESENNAETACNVVEKESIKQDYPRDEEEQDDEEEEGFNEDILCVHGELCVEESRRRLIPKQVWDILKSYFPLANTFSEDAEPCSLCQNLATEGKATRDMYRQTAALQKENLTDLYYDRNRVSFGCSPTIQKQKQPQDQTFHLVSKEFINCWRRFIRDSGRRDPETNIENQVLLCPHGGLLFDPESPEETGSRFVVVSDAEWTTLCSFYSMDHDITVRRDSTTNVLLCEPAICIDCVMARIKVEEMELLQYDKAKIFVRKVARTDTNNGQIQETGNSNPPSQPENKDDPEYQGSDPKRPKLALGDCSSPTPGGAISSNDSRVRKSTRHRRMRGERELIVSSKLTLLEFKVMVMKLFQVAPFDQHLSIDGRDLMDNSATLGSLQVYPDSIILLKADEPSEDPSMMDDYMKSGTFEEGFKGTELLK